MRDVTVRFVSREVSEGGIRWVATVERTGQSLPDPRVVRLGGAAWEDLVRRAGSEEAALAALADEVAAIATVAPCQVVIDIDAARIGAAGPPQNVRSTPIGK